MPFFYLVSRDTGYAIHLGEFHSWVEAVMFVNREFVATWSRSFYVSQSPGKFKAGQ